MIKKILDFNRDKTIDKIISKVNELVDEVNKLEKKEK